MWSFEKGSVTLLWKWNYWNIQWILRLIFARNIKKWSYNIIKIVQTSVDIRSWCYFNSVIGYYFAKKLQTAACICISSNINEIYLDYYWRNFFHYHLILPIGYYLTSRFFSIFSIYLKKTLLTSLTRMKMNLFSCNGWTPRLR